MKTQKSLSGISALILGIILAVAAVPMTVYAIGGCTHDESSAPARKPGAPADITETESAAPNGLACSFEELLTMLDEGGTAALGASITVPAEESLDIDGEIYTGEYGIIAEGYLTLLEGAVITGEGVSRPVVEIASGGSLLAGYSSEFESSPHIVAEGGGGLALLLREDTRQNYVSGTTFLRVTADGAGAVAVQSDGACQLFRYFIEAPDGVGVLCPEEVSLFLCKIEAGAAAVQAPGFTADTCVLSLEGGAGGTVIDRKISQDSYVRIFVRQGGHVSEDEAGRAEFAVTLRAEGYEDDSAMLGATVKLPDIDTDKTGVYPLEAVLEECWAAFDLLPGDEILIAVEVYNPEIPYFRDAAYFFGTFYVDYLFEGDLSGLTLWRSDDGGESWYGYTEDAELDYSTGYMISLPFDEQPEHPVWLAWEAEGVGESEVLRLSWENGSFSGDFGGDRGGIGRGEAEKPPADAPSPEPQTPPQKPQNGHDDKDDDDDDHDDDDENKDGYYNEDDYYSKDDSYLTPEPAAKPQPPAADSGDDKAATPAPEKPAPDSVNEDILSASLSLTFAPTQETPPAEPENAAEAVTETPIPPPFETPSVPPPQETASAADGFDKPAPVPAEVSAAPGPPPGNTPVTEREKPLEPEEPPAAKLETAAIPDELAPVEKPEAPAAAIPGGTPSPPGVSEPRPKPAADGRPPALLIGAVCAACAGAVTGFMRRKSVKR